MKIFNIEIFLLLAIAVIVSSCGTLFPGNSSIITIESDRGTANIIDNDGKIIATTPYTFTASKSENYSFVVSKKGFMDKQLIIKPRVRTGVLFGDAMMLCLPCIIDIPNKAHLEFPRSSYKVDLEMDNSANREESMFDEDLYVNINLAKVAFKEGQVLGKVNSSTIKYKEAKRYETTGHPDFYTDAVCSEFKNYHLNSIKCGISKYEPQSRMLIPQDKQPFIQVSVDSWTFGLTQKKKIYGGSGTMVTTWKVLDPANDMKVLHERKITTTLDAEEHQMRYFFSRLMQKSAAKFIEEDSLVAFIKNRNFITPETMKGETIELSKLTNPVFPKFKDLVNYSTKAVVTIKQKEGFGSGVIISNSGYILTNYHVIDEKGQVTVKLNTGITLTAKVIKTNTAADLALLKVDAQDLPALPFATGEIEVGEEAVAIGTPGDLALEQTVSKGIVSGKRVIEGKKFLQTDVSINPGNSGGPLLNDQGQILGIITMKIIGKGLEGLGFALSTEEVIRLLNLKIK
jgi:hypothetical protein